MPPSNSELTVGIDIGTSSVKAVAADADGTVVARSRIPHDFYVPSPLRFEHDAVEAWCARAAPCARCARRHRAARRLGRGDGPVAHRGRRRRRSVRARPALRRRTRPPGTGRHRTRRWASSRSSCSGMPSNGPDARGYWMAQAVANHSLTGRPVISTTVGGSTMPLMGMHGGWDEALITAAGARVDQMPEFGISGQPLADVHRLRRLRPRGRHDRRDGRADRRGRRRGRRRARDPRHHVDRVGGVARPRSRLAVLLGAAHRARWEVVVRRSEQRGRPLPRVGVALLGRRRRRRRALGAAQHPDLGPVPARRTGAGERRDATRRVGRPGPDARRRTRSGAPRSKRRGSSRAASSRPRRFPRGASSRPAAVPASRAGSRRSPTRTGLPVHVAAVPEGGALGAAFLARMAAGLETDMARRGALGAHGTHRRARSGLGPSTRTNASRASVIAVPSPGSVFGDMSTCTRAAPRRKARLIAAGVIAALVARGVRW